MAATTANATDVPGPVEIPTIGMLEVDASPVDIRAHCQALDKLREKRSRCTVCDSRIQNWNVTHPFPCLHVTCDDSCLERCLTVTPDEGQVYTCPICSTMSDKKRLDRYRPLWTSVLKREEILFCSCSAGTIFWCDGCEKAMCTKCKEDHFQADDTTGHVIRLVDPYPPAQDKDELKCARHRYRGYKVCTSCNMILCAVPNCYRGHSGHKMIPIEECVQQTRNRVKEAEDKMKQYIFKSDDLLAQLNEELKKARNPETGSKILDAFRLEFQKIMDFITECEHLIRVRIKESSLTRAKDLNMQRYLVQSHVDQLGKFLHAIGDPATLSAKTIANNYSILQERLEELEEGMDATAIIEPEIPDQPTAPMEDVPSESNGNAKTQPSSPIQNGSGTAAETNDPLSQLPLMQHMLGQVRSAAALMEGALSDPVESSGSPKPGTPVQPSVPTPGEANGKTTSDEPEGEENGSTTNDTLNEEMPLRTESAPQSSFTLRKSRRRRTQAEILKERAGVLSLPPKRSSKAKARHFDDYDFDSRIITRRRSSASSSRSFSVSSNSSGHSSRSPTPKKKLPPKANTLANAEEQEVFLTPSRLAPRAFSAPITPGNEKKRRRRRKGGGWSSGNDKPNKLKKKPKVVATGTSTPDTMEPMAGPSTSSSIGTPKRRGRPKLIRPNEPPILSPATAAIPTSTGDEEKVSDPSVPVPLEVPMVIKEKEENDPNEDYCAVCLDGGDGLVCCDFCPKVFHVKCHLPAMTGVPKDDWRCMFCKTKDDIPELNTKKTMTAARKLALVNLEVASTLPYGQFFNACKFLCELYKVPDLSRLMVHFYMNRKTVDEKPLLDLHAVRARLTLAKPQAYRNTKEIIPALKNMFEKAKQFYKDTPQHAFVLSVETKFKEIVTEYFPPDEKESTSDEEEMIDEEKELPDQSEKAKGKDDAEDQSKTNSDGQLNEPMDVEEPSSSQASTTEALSTGEKLEEGSVDHCAGADVDPTA